jgi:hypothetical protein
VLFVLPTAFLLLGLSWLYMAGGQLRPDKGRVVLDGPAWDDKPTSAFAREGGVLGDVGALLAERPQPMGGLVVSGRAQGFFVDRPGLAQFLDDNPGVRVRVQPWTAREETSTELAMARMVTEHVDTVAR